MAMFHKILVPLDGSEIAEYALEPALTIARQVEGEVLLLSVPHLKQALIRSHGEGTGFLWPEQSMAADKQRLATYLGEVHEKYAHPLLRLHTKVVEGDEASMIVDTAVTEQVDLIVMSTHGRSGFSRWVLGSVTEKVLRAAPCPVLVIRQPIALTRTLITLDGSILSECALSPGLAVTSVLGGSVTLLRVEATEIEDPLLTAVLDRIDKEAYQTARDTIYRQTENYVQTVAQAHQVHIDQPIKVAALLGEPAHAILDYIEDEGINLVVMATHGRTGLSRWVYGSVTEKVLREGNCAFLVVRPPADAFP